MAKRLTMLIAWLEVVPALLRLCAYGCAAAATAARRDSKTVGLSPFP